MENVVDLRLNYDDKGLVEIQQKQVDLVKQQVKAFNEMEKAVNSVYQDAVDQSKAYNDAIRENLEQLSAQELQIKKTSSAAQLYEKAVDRITDVFGQYKDQAVGAINNLKGYASGLLSSARAATGFTKVLKILRIALISTGIGAIVIALTGLVVAFGRTQAGGEKLAQFMRGLTSTVDVLIGRFGRIGNAIIGVFTGTKSLGEATKEAAGAFRGLGKEMSEAYKEGVQIEKLYQQLEKSARQLSVDESQIQKRVAYLQTIAEKEGVSARKAIGAVSAARSAEIELIDRQIEQQENVLKLKQLEANTARRNGTITKDQLDAEAEARITLNNLETDRITTAAEYASQLDQIRQKQREEARERQEQLKKLRDEYNKLLGDLEKRLDKASVTGLDGIEKLLAERDVAIAELLDFQKSIEDAAAKANIKIPEETKRQILTLFSEVEDEFVRQAAEFRKNNPFETIETLAPLADKERARELERIIRENSDRLASAAVDQALRNRPLFQKIKDDLTQAFNVTEEELSLVTDLIGQSVSQLDDIIFAGTQRQIAQNDALIKSIEDRVKAAETAYQDELKLKEQGLANDAALREKELREEQTRLQRAQEQKEALEKKALRQQLISDSLAQASQLALGAAKVISAESSKGLVGIVTAAAGIALLFRIIAQAKANAAKVSTAPKFRKGGVLEGASHEQGGIPILVGGVRLVEAEGGEMIVSKRHTTPNVRFLDNLNKGKYAGMDLLSVAEQAKQRQNILYGFNRMADNGRVVSAKLIKHESKVIDYSTRDEVRELRRTVVLLMDELKRRPVIIPIGKKYKKEWTEGGVKNVEIYRPKE